MQRLRWERRCVRTAAWSITSNHGGGLCPGGGEGAAARHHPQQVSLNNHPEHNRPLCVARRAGKVTSWAAGSFQRSQRQKPWQMPTWRTCWASVLPACSLGHDLATTGNRLPGAAAVPGTQRPCFPSYKRCFYAKGMPTQKVLTHLSCLQPCWWRTGLGLPVQCCRINALLAPSFTPNKAGGNTCSSHQLKCLLQGPIFGSL